MTGSRSFLVFLFILMEILFYGAETSNLPGVGTSIMDNKPMENKEGPYFELSNRKNLTFVKGHNAYLQCRVKNLGDRHVSWIRKRDLHVLTFNLASFTSDARFNLIHPQDSEDWTLEIKFVQTRDSGVYECQVNTEPKINMAVHLIVEEREVIWENGIQSTRSTKEALASITGPEFVRTSSTISLTCSVNIHSQPAASVTWYHGQNIVDFNSPRGGISMETTKSEQGTVSKLVITKASPADAGNYTCVPNNAGPASVLVHVVNGEHSEPIHHVEHGSSALTSSSSILLTSLVISIHFLWQFINIPNNHNMIRLHSIP